MKKVFLLWTVFMLMTVSLSAQDRVQERDQDRLMMRDGSVCLYQNQECIPLREQLRLQNGTSVNPDGSYQLRNGKQLRLRDGQCMDMEGRRYSSEARCMARMERRKDKVDRTNGNQRMDRANRNPGMDRNDRPGSGRNRGGN